MPTYLVGYMYKILANRLRKGAQWVIDKKQSVFLGGRNFFNGVVVSYEVIDEAKRKKKRRIALSLRLILKRRVILDVGILCFTRFKD